MKREYYESFDEVPDLKTWLNSGKPLRLVKMEKFKQYTAYFDVAYGNIHLYEKGKEVAMGKYMCTIPGVVVLDKDYYGVEKYIWV